jgi:hypothetical protein
MDGERARVTDVGDVIKELQRVDELATGLDAALKLKSDKRPVASFKIGVGATAKLSALQSRENDVRDRRMGAEEIRNLNRVLIVLP